MRALRRSSSAWDSPCRPVSPQRLTIGSNWSAGPNPRLGKDIVRVRLVRASDGKPVTDAVILKARPIWARPAMATMPAPVNPFHPKDGVYRFEVAPGMTGTWALHLAAKVQGETGTVKGTINANLVN
ncbi:MAG: FixH family protein [Methylovirgula sp.]